MTNLSATDLKFIHLGIIGNGKFDENDIAKSELSKLGVGRVLDQLASLKERNLLRINDDGTFSITEKARTILWDSKTPLEIKILRALAISPQMAKNIVSILQISEKDIQNMIEKLQKNHLLLMSTIKNEIGIVKSYEILPEGLEYLEKAKSGEIKELFALNPQRENIKIIQNVIEEIKKLNEISSDIKDRIIYDLKQVEKNLEDGSF